MCFAACVNKYSAASNLTGEITSPNFPGLYPHNTKCNYIFNGHGKRVQIVFTHFDVIGLPPA